MVYAAGGHSTGMRDRSLEEFVDGDDEPDDSDEPDGSENGDVEPPASGDDSTDAGEATPDSDVDADPAPESNERATDASGDSDATDGSDGEGVEAAVSTFEWAPGAECVRCGGAAERRWRDDDELVCADCKPW
jgi:hypothetical protein